jgi:hypothetical protein
VLCLVTRSSLPAIRHNRASEWANATTRTGTAARNCQVIVPS